MRRLDADAKAALQHKLRESVLALVGVLFPEKIIISKDHEIRIGRKGSLAINIRSGVWYDHESGEGGDMFDLIMHAAGCDFKQALVFARSWSGQPSLKPVQLVSPQTDDQRREKIRQFAIRLWNQCRPIGGDYASC